MLREMNRVVVTSRTGLAALASRGQKNLDSLGGEMTTTV